MRNGFYFAGRHSSEFGLTVETAPARRKPARKRTTVSVPGRNGDLHYDEGAFENVLQPYVCGFSGDRPVSELAHEIAGWLYGSSGQQRLEDDYDPDHFRMATFAGPMDIENQLNRVGKITIEFDCDPQCWLKSGERAVLMPWTPGFAKRLLNPTGFAAKPLMIARGVTDGATLIIGTGMVEINGSVDAIYIDCDTQNAYTMDETGAQVNANSMIFAEVFPELQPGLNVVAWSGNCGSVEIEPRWWTI